MKEKKEKKNRRALKKKSSMSFMFIIHIFAPIIPRKTSAFGTPRYRTSTPESNQTQSLRESEDGETN